MKSSPPSSARRLRDKAHRRFVTSKPCLVCGRQPSDPHHLRFAQPRALGLKVSDEFTVPLCRGHHRQLHQAGNEVAWWKNLEISAPEIAKGLWEESHRMPYARKHPAKMTKLRRVLTVCIWLSGRSIQFAQVGLWQYSSQMAGARIVIVNFNAGDNLRRCIAALSAQTKTDFEVRIVDNASTDGSLRYVPDDDRFLVIHAGRNVGFAAGCNLGASDCAAPFVVFLNPDAFPEPGWLEALLRAAKNYPDAAMFGSLQVSATDGIFWTAPAIATRASESRGGADMASR
jgi:hypothetical protein